MGICRGGVADGDLEEVLRRMDALDDKLQKIKTTEGEHNGAGNPNQA